MEQGALWGGITGGLAQGMTMAGVPDAFAQAGSGYLVGSWEGGAVPPEAERVCFRWLPSISRIGHERC